MRSRPRHSQLRTTVSVSSALSRRPAYAPTGGSYRAHAAPIWRRVVAGVIDWVGVITCYLIVNIPLGMIQRVSEELGSVVKGVAYVAIQAAALSVVAGYFAFFFRAGSTLGMRALDIHVVSYGTGEAPGLLPVVWRSLLSVVFFLSSFTAYTYLFGHYESPLTSFEEIARASSIGVAVVALGGHLWKLVDEAGRSVWDRAAGLIVVEDIVPNSMPDRLWAPWGP